MTSRWTVATINAFPIEEAIARLGHLYEHSPWVVERAWRHRPFASVAAFHAALGDQVRRADLQEQLALIRAHPDLVGRAALRGSLTSASTAEQQAAGLGAGDLSNDEKSRFAELNEQYNGRFGFPFVICARENKKQTILDGFDTRLGNDPVIEVATALREIDKIAWYRLTDLVRDDELDAVRPALRGN